MSDNYSILSGSICLTDIPRDQIKRVMCKDGKERCYLNVAVIPRRTPNNFGNRTYTHFLSCAPKKEERKEGVNYIIGDLETRVFGPTASSASPSNNTQNRQISAPPLQKSDSSDSDSPF